MSTTTHLFTPEEIMAFVDGELSPVCAQSVSAHLEQCAECSHLANQLSGTSQVLRQWQVDTLPALVQEHILSAASSAPSFSRADRNLLTKLRILFSRPIPLAAVCTALLVVVGIQLISRRPASDRFMARAPMYKLETVRPSGPSADPVPEHVVEDSAEMGRSSYRGKGSDAYSVGSADKSPATSVDHTKLGRQPGQDEALDHAKAPMIARTVALSIVAKEFDASRAALEAILARHNGYAAELNVATPQGAGRTIQASLRIPAPQLVAAVAELKALGRVENESQNGEEVTQQHADLVARLKNSRETEQRLQDVLRTRTGKVKDVLEVEEEIARVRGEIEQMEAEQQTLEHRVNFATIDLKLAEEYKAQLTTPAPSAAMQLRNATVNGFRGAFESLLALVLFLAESGPTLLLWLMLLSFPAWLLWRRYQRSLAMS